MSGWRGDGWQDAPDTADPQEWAQAYRVAREQEAVEAQEWEDAELEELAAEAEVRSRRRRRGRRALITLLVLLLVLFFGFWYAYSYIRSEGASASGVSCVPAGAQSARPGEVTLNVYNATKRSGLAAATSKSAVAAGFVAGKIANDPLGKTIEGPAEVRYGPSGKAGAELVMTMVGKGAVGVDDGRQEGTVDLVLGNAFNTLGPVPSPGLPACPASSPSPSASAS